MKTKEELEFIKMWFEELRDMAGTCRNANILVSPKRMLEEISVKAKEAAEYVNELIKKSK